MTPQEKLFISELTMKLFTHAWLKFDSFGSVFVGEIGGYRFLGNHLSLDILNTVEVRQFTTSDFGEKTWHAVRHIGYYSFGDILRSNGIDNTCTVVSEKSDQFTSVFSLPNGDEIILTMDPKKVMEVEKLSKQSTP